MKLSLARRVSSVALALAAALSASAAYAQTSVYTFSQNVPGAGTLTHQYALLNGDLLALYINDRGDLGAPFRFTTPEKSFGDINQTTGQPLFVNPDGSIDTTRTGTYAALFSNTPTPVGSTSVPGSIGPSVSAKSEYITGFSIPTEGFSIVGDDPDLHGPGNTWLHGATLDTAPTFSAPVGTTSTGPLSITSNLSAPTSSGTLAISQTVAFQQSSNPDQQNRVQFTVNFTNNGTQTLTGIQYARVVNPNQGEFGSTSTAETTQFFRTPTDPSAFAIDSVAQARHLAFGVLPTDQSSTVQVVGTTILATNVTSEGALLDDPTAQVGLHNHVVLLAGMGANYLSPAGSLLGSTTDYVTDTTFNPAFDPLTGDVALELLSPTLTIDPGQTETFIFYYFFNPLAPPSAVPEPGALAFLVTGALSGGLWLIHRRKKG